MEKNTMEEYPLICRSIKSTESSLASLFCVSIEKLKYLLAINYSELYQRMTYHEEDFPNFLYQKFLGDNKIKPNHVSRIHWFHGTRSFSETSFLNEGILPLNQILMKILEQIDHLARKTGITPDVTTSKNDNRHSFGLFVEKTENPMHWGPYGVLIRDALVNPKLYNCHDYIGVPEIIEDYMNIKYSSNYDSLFDAYLKETYSYIIEYWTLPMNRQVDTTKAALLGLYYFYLNEPPYDQCNTCYDGQGVLIPCEQIIGVENLINNHMHEYPRRK
jgi:hypothetical protein